MRLAICGRAGSGKSTLADYLVNTYRFEKYSFAGAVKEIARELFGMTKKDRTLLQAVGTKMREIDNGVWIRYVMNRIIADDCEDVIIDDLRYLNEALFLKANGFIIVKLVGRSRQLSALQRAHDSEMGVDLIEPDYVIDTSKSLGANYRELEKLVMRHKLDDLRMSADYYTKAEEKGKGNVNYRRGRDFEYRVMRHLRARGWHCMRKFGSKDDIWNVDGERVHVPVDVTAYKDGVYLIISCKYSIKGPTTYLDDPKREDLIRYCRLYGPDCIPIMACVNEARHVYLIDLRDYSTMTLLRMSKRGPRGVQVDESQMSRLLAEAWATLDLLKEEYKTAKETGDDVRRVAWTSEIVKLVNVINRLLKAAGETASEDDITTLIAELGDELSG